ncbi:MULTISPECIES: HK97-gp10 family putative phage morphogenesis protein [unclassified Cytobacillus]|uniref:HK97-gp10 family putative phage morphogenesis protein n=1 Tax=unclassified Cytobacillus TaxID=2675268 RepID=UPI0030F56732
MDFQMDGLSEMMNRLASLENMDEIKNEALKEGAKALKEETERTVVKRTGNLSRNILVSDINNDEIFVHVDNQGKAYYGHMLEFGTSKMSAQPFMGPAFNRSKMSINNAMAEKIRQHLR